MDDEQRDKVVVARLTDAEHARAMHYVSDSGVTVTALVRDAIALGSGDLGVDVTADGAAPLLAALDVGGRGLNEAARLANRCALRFGKVRNVEGERLESFLDDMRAAASCAAASEAACPSIRDCASALVAAARYLAPSTRDDGGRRPVVARSSPEAMRRFDEAAARQRLSRSRFLRACVMLVVDSGGPPHDIASLLLVRPTDLARLDVATNRWATNLSQMESSIDMLRRRHEYSRYMDGMTSRVLVQDMDACVSASRRAVASVQVACAPVLALGGPRWR